jgi:hypothetical protein
MVMEDDAQKKARTKSGAGWGGFRQKHWDVMGKRAVVQVDPIAYEFVIQLARMCKRTNKDMCSQIFAAGLESLTGFSIKEICEEEFGINVRSSVGERAPFTHEEVRLAAKKFFIIDGELADGR